MKVAFPKNARSLSIRFGARQWERLRQVAVERGETLAELVRSALERDGVERYRQRAVATAAPPARRRPPGRTGSGLDETQVPDFSNFLLSFRRESGENRGCCSRLETTTPPVPRGEAMQVAVPECR